MEQLPNSPSAVPTPPVAPPTPVPVAPVAPVAKKGTSPILLAILGLVIIGGIAFAGLTLWQKGFLGGILPAKEPLPTPFESVPTPTIELSPTSTQTKKPSPTTGKPKGPTLTPTPVWLNDPLNEFTCGNEGELPPSPAFGKTPLLVALYPFASIGGGNDFIAGYQFDFDGNGTWDTDIIKDSPIIHTYGKEGNYQPKYRIRGTKNTWSEPCEYKRKVVVGEAPAFENEVISVDKINVSATVSKAHPEYSFPAEETKYFLGTSTRAFRPGFSVSTKNQFLGIRFKKGDEVDYGVFEVGYDLNAGTSTKFHLFIGLAKPNGTYRGSAIVQYWKDGRTQDGPTINYEITLTD